MIVGKTFFKQSNIYGIQLSDFKLWICQPIKLKHKAVQLINTSFELHKNTKSTLYLKTNKKTKKHSYRWSCKLFAYYLQLYFWNKDLGLCFPILKCYFNNQSLLNVLPILFHDSLSKGDLNASWWLPVVNMRGAGTNFLVGLAWPHRLTQLLWWCSFTK